MDLDTACPSRTSEVGRRVAVSRDDASLAATIIHLQDIAKQHGYEYASLVVRADGRVVVEVSDSRKGFRTVERLDIDEHGVVTKQPLHSYPRGV